MTEEARMASNNNCRMRGIGFGVPVEFYEFFLKILKLMNFALDKYGIFYYTNIVRCRKDYLVNKRCYMR